MSSIHCFRTLTGFAVLSDGAVTDLHTGNLAATTSKVWCGNNFAVGLLGHPHNLIAGSARALAEAQSFDHVCDLIDKQLPVRKVLTPDCLATVPVVGWSDRTQSWVMVVANFSDQDPNFAPWSINVIEGAEFSRGPVVPLEEMKEIFAGRLWQFDEPGIRRIGADYFEAQRRIKMQTPGFPPMHMVGSFVELTIVDHAGVRQERLRTLEQDVVGRPIEPLAA
ncbi:MAG: hypothetical protein JNK47_16840 [Mesorhizobium sp.]|nr:hypothetical protein [Mesorhizobium sp.]MBL8578892.1 hypothetical protein [Mesorhizobium sp.]